MPLTFAWKLDTPAVPIASYYYGLDEDPPTSTTTNTSVTIPAPSLGAHTFRVFASSTSGLNSSVLTAAFTCDNAAANIPPTVVITSGASGITYDNTPTFTYQASDVDGTIAGYFVGINENPPTFWTANNSWTSPELSCGSYTFYLMAQDNEGANSTLVSRPFNLLENVGNETTYEWTRVLGLPDSGRTYGKCVLADNSGNVFLAGQWNGTCNFAFDWGGNDSRTCLGFTDIYLTKILADGSYAWTRTFGSDQEEKINGGAIDSQGNVYLTGEFIADINFAEDWGGSDVKTVISMYPMDAFIIKINNDGSYGWTKKFGGTNTMSVRGSSIAIGSDDTVYLSITMIREINFGADWGQEDWQNSTDWSNTNQFTVIINNDGSFGGSRKIGGLGKITYLGIAGIAVDSGGSVYTTGYFKDTVNFLEGWGGYDNRTSAGDWDIFVTKVDGAGNRAWTRVIGGEGEEGGRAIDTDELQGVYISGNFKGIVDFGNEWGFSDIRIPAHTIAGSCFVLKIMDDGSFGWVRTVSGKSWIDRNCLRADIGHGVIVSGAFNEEINFGEFWGLSDIKATSGPGDPDLYLMCLWSDGTYGWTKRIGSLAEDRSGGIAVDYAGNIFVTGELKGTTFNAAEDWGGTDIKTLSESNAFLTKISR